MRWQLFFGAITQFTTLSYYPSLTESTSFPSRLLQKTSYTKEQSEIGDETSSCLVVFQARQPLIQSTWLIGLSSHTIKILSKTHSLTTQLAATIAVKSPQRGRLVRQGEAGRRNEATATTMPHCMPLEDLKRIACLPPTKF